MVVHREISLLEYNSLVSLKVAICFKFVDINLKYHIVAMSVIVNKLYIFHA
jgi:hypothetical protein